MNLILLFDRVKNKVCRSYRKYVFRKRIHCAHGDFSMVGNVTLINTNIQLGRNVTIYPNVMFFGDGPIVIGDNVNIGNNTIIYASRSGGVTIGNDTMIAAHCYIIDMDHGMIQGKLMREQANTVEPVTIGSDVWFGNNVTVLKGSNVGDGAVIGAKAMVKGIITENAVAVGIPAKEIKYRNIE